MKKALLLGVLALVACDAQAPIDASMADAGSDAGSSGSGGGCHVGGRPSSLLFGLMLVLAARRRS